MGTRRKQDKGLTEAAYLPMISRGVEPPVMGTFLSGK